MAQLSIPWLSLITNLELCSMDILKAKIVRAVQAGINSVQLRDKKLPSEMLLQLGKELRQITKDQALFFVHDRVDIALACEADGIQLSENGITIDDARTLLGPDVLIGRSVHSLDSAVDAENCGADFLIVGTIFRSQTHPTQIAAGPELLANIAPHVSIPKLAIGGITTNNISSVIYAGANGAAVISSILGDKDPYRATMRLRHKMEDAWTQQSQLGHPND